MTVLLHAAIDKSSLPVAGKRGLNRVAYWLIAPGVLWMTLFLVVPILMIVYVSFWTQTTFKIEPILTTRQLGGVFCQRHLYRRALDHRSDLADRAVHDLAGRLPTALFVGLFVKNKDAVDRASGSLRDPVLDLVFDPRPRLAADAGQRGRHQHHPANASHHIRADRRTAVHGTIRDHRNDPDLLCLHGWPDRVHAGKNRSERDRSGAGSGREFRPDIPPPSFCR